VITVVAELSPKDWLRLNGLLAQALEFTPEDQLQWLQTLPTDQRDLLPLLERLLQPAVSADACDSADPIPALQVFDDQRHQQQNQPGDHIGPYRLLHELGRGGMATVWRADRTDGRIERQVALKIPNAEWTDRGLADRIRRECAVLASLNHPNVAQLYDAGWSESGLPYLAMEVVDGQPIDRFCSERSLSVRMRVRLFVEVLRAVAYAHARLVVHRDLKPANVLVTGEGRVKLLDFGIAKVLSDSAGAAGESDLTRSAGRPITLAYAAPEQVLGQPVTTATDIYALGIMLFELLCGQRPFPPQTETRSAIEEVMARGDPPRPSSLASDRTSVRALRGDLDVITCKALQKNPDGRFETAAAFADDLTRYLEGRAIHAQRGSAWYRLRRFVLRNKLALGATAAVTAAVLGGLTTALWQTTRAEREAQNSAAIGNFVLSVIQQADPDASQQTKQSDLALLRTVEERIDRQLSARPDLRFPLHLAVATSYRNRGEVKEAGDILRKSLRDAEEAPQLKELDVLRARVLLGEVSSDDKERAQMLDPAIPALRRLGRPAAPVLVDALLAHSPSTILKDPGADKDLREALKVAKTELGLSDEQTLKAANQLATALGPGVQSRNEEAAAILEPVILAVRASGVLPASNPTMLHALSTYGSILCSTGRAAEGVPILEQTVQIAIDQHHDGQQLRSALLYLARGQRYAGQFDASIATFASIYALLASREPFGSRLRYYYGGDVSYNLMQARRPLEAEPFIEEAQAFRDSLSAAEKTLAGEADFQISFRRLGTLLRLGEYAAARQIGEGLLQKSREDKAPYYGYVANIFMGDVYLATDDPKDAEAAARSGLQYALQQGGATNDLALHYGALSRIELARGDAAQALAVTDPERNQPSPSAAVDPDGADFNLARGRAMLALGRAADARRPLGAAHAFWSAFAPDSNAAQVATYWYAKALSANGEGDVAQRLSPAGRAPLDYPSPDLPRLRADRSKSAQQRIAAVLQKYPLRPEIAALIAQGAAPNK
jgi:eukaryotic-like serine/threonine-protein kinase